MLTVFLERTTRNGRPSHGGLYISEARDTDPYGGNPERLDMEQFLRNTRLRDVLLLKGELEELITMPHITYEGVDLTDKLLCQLVTGLEKIFGKLDYTTPQNKQQQGTLQYLQDNGVKLKQHDGGNNQ